MRKKVKTLLISVILTLIVSNAWAINYYFDEHYSSISNAPHIQDVELNGYVTPHSGWSAMYVNEGGAYETGYTMLLWQDIHNFTGTVKYFNYDYSYSCSFTDFYENGDLINSKIRCPRTGFRSFFSRSASFWAP